MNDTPGRMLSSLTGGDKQHPKLGGCVGVFFQVFDWNRRLSANRFFANKLLPAGGRKQVSKKFKDDKLPMAKLLLIADENRGGFPNAQKHSASESICGRKEVFDNGATGRCSPGVVARLMGLDSMPIPDSRKEGKQDMQHRKAIEVRPIQDLLQSRHNPKLEERQQPMELKKSSLGRKLNGIVRKSSEVRLEKSEEATRYALSKKQSDMKVGKAISTLARHVAKTSSDRFDDPRVSIFSRLPPLSPCADSPLKSIFSSSKSHNKLGSPIRSPLAVKSTSRLFEAASRILEPSMQPRNRLRLSTNTPVGRSLVKDNDSGKDAEKKVIRKIGASKKGPSNLVRALKDQPLSKSWSGPNTEQASQMNPAIVRKSGNGSSSRLGFVSSLVHRVQNSQEIGSQIKTERGTSGIAKRQEREKPAYSVNELEHRHREHERIARGQSRLASLHLPAGQEVLHRSGDVREEILPISSPQLCRSKSAKERSKVSTQEVGSEAHQRLSGARTRIQSVPNVVKQEQKTKKLTNEVGTAIGMKNSRVKQAISRKSKETDPPRKKALPLDTIVTAANRNNLNASASSHSGGGDISFELTNRFASDSVSSDSIINNGGPSNFGKDGKRTNKGKEVSNNGKTVQGKENSSFLRSLQRRRSEMGNMKTSSERNGKGKSSERISLECNLLNADGFEAPESTEVRTANNDSVGAQEFDALSCTFVENFKFEDADLSCYGELSDRCTVEGDTRTMAVSHRHENWIKSSYLGDYGVNEDLSDCTIKGGIGGRNNTSSSFPYSLCSSRDSRYSNELAEASYKRCESLNERSDGICGGVGSTEKVVTDFTYGCSDVTSRWSEVEAAALNSSQSSCDWSEELRDTASSDARWELICNRNENTSSAGKTTAAILEELLVALNKSGPLFPVKGQSKAASSSSSPSEHCGRCQHGKSSNIGENSQNSSVGCPEEHHLVDFHAANNCGSREEGYEVTKVSLDKIPSKRRVCSEEACDFSSDSMSVDDSYLHSPISILESPFQDVSSNTSENFDSGQGSKYPPSSTSQQSRDVEHAEESDPVSYNCDSAFSAPASSANLTIRNEEEYVREIIYAAAKSDDLQLLDGPPLIDQTLFCSLESKVAATAQEWGTPFGIYSSNQDDRACDCGDEAVGDMRYSDTQNENAGWQKRKLIFDCASEVLSSMYSKYSGVFCVRGPSLLHAPGPSLLHAPSRSHLVRAVYNQIQDWSEMGESLMLDELVEKEMNTASSGKWANVEVAELGLEIERIIFWSLMEELVGDIVMLHVPAEPRPPPHLLTRKMNTDRTAAAAAAALAL